MYIKQILVGPMQNFSYLVGEKKGEVAYIDPGYDSDQVLKITQDEGLKVTKVLLTHSHYDHSQEVAYVLTNTQAELYVGQASLSEFSDLKCKVHGLVDNDEIKLGKMTIKVMATPGHKSDAVCYYLNNNLFTGDTLFIDGVGRTDLPTGNSQQLKESIEKIARLPGNTVIYPGHDYGPVPFRTVAEELHKN